MSSLRPLLALAVLTVLTASSGSAQTNAERARALQGAWSFVETSNPRTLQIIDNQPGFRLFVDGHFAWVRVNGLRPRPQIDSTAVAAQIYAVYNTNFTAHAGTYEVRGDTLITRTAVHDNPAGMAAGAYNVWLYRMMGDDLYVTQVGNQDGPVNNVVTGHYRRVRFPATPTN
jgi:hypothetical protein